MVKIAKCFSAAPDAAWRKKRTYLLPDNTVERQCIVVLQSHLTRKYFRTANIVDIHNQYRHGIPVMERPCKTKSWNLRLFQTVMGNVLVIGFLAFKFKTGQSPSLSNFTNGVAQALCTDKEEEADNGAAGRTRAQKQSSAWALIPTEQPGDCLIADQAQAGLKNCCQAVLTNGWSLDGSQTPPPWLCWIATAEHVVWRFLWPGSLVSG
jgi:hypothetical protein